MKNQELLDVGKKMHDRATDLFSICRSLTGPGVRKTLSYIQERLPNLNIASIPSGTQVFDWTVPDEWTIRDAYIIDPDGKKIVDFKNHNLHVVGYSTPIEEEMDLEELEKHLFSLPDQPEAIPYITSYYSRRWGFCLTHNQRSTLKKGRYKVVIDSDLNPGVLNYGELLIKGQVEEEILLSTYICHPSMGNNELSGPVMAMALCEWIQSLEKTKYSYRILFLPETIGPISYLSQNYEYMKKVTIAGFVLTCVGDDLAYSYLPSRKGGTLADRASVHVLSKSVETFDTYSFLDRGSDERQYCSAGIDLPVCSIMRSKYATYPEYHTSLDDLNFISAKGLAGAFEILQKTLQTIEVNRVYKNTVLCEPQLGKRGLYPTISTLESRKLTSAIMNFLAYADGTIDLIDIAQLIDEDALALHDLALKLLEVECLSVVNNQANSVCL
jgi:aminopeptidase-like protein